MFMLNSIIKLCKCSVTVSTKVCGTLRVGSSPTIYTKYGVAIWDRLGICNADERVRVPSTPPNLNNISKPSNADGREGCVRLWEKKR